MYTTDPESKSKWLTDINKRKFLFKKANLIKLFTVADLPVVENTKGSGNTNRNIGDIVEEEEFNYRGYEFISFPENEIETLKTQLVIYTTRTQEEYGKYRLNHTYVTPWNLTYRVTAITRYEHLKDHPFLNELTQEQKLEIGSNPFELIKLSQLSIKDQYKGYDLFTDKSYIFGVIYPNNTYANDNSEVKYVVLEKYGNPPYGIYQKFILHANEIENHNGQDITTTYGRYLVNYFALADPFGSVISYINSEIKIPKIESIIAEKIRLKELTTEQGGKYLDNVFFIGSFGEMSVPAFSRKSLTTSPKVKQRKKELLEQYKDQLDNPVIISQIEDELIALDKEWLKGDPSMGYFGDTGKKFNVHRKKQYLIGGLIEDFKKEKGSYEFIPNALSEGWDINSFVTICNEIRKGSYNRGIETAQGGVESKRLMRLLQNLKITGEDCGTTEYLEQVLTNDLLDKYYGRYLLDSDGKLVILDKANSSRFLNKKVKIRSFMYCKQPDGFCHVCGGSYFKNIGQDVVGVLALELTSTFLTMSMKNMHGSKVETMNIDNLDRYVV